MLSHKPSAQILWRAFHLVLDRSHRFCDQEESVTHLFFVCPADKVAQSLGADDRPQNLAQSWKWAKKWLPNGNKFHAFGIAAICWAIWKTRNKACFDGKLAKYPAEIVCYACAFMRYWTGLYLAEIQEMMVERVNTMLHVATRLLAESAFFGSDAAGGRTLKGWRQELKAAWRWCGSNRLELSSYKCCKLCVWMCALWCIRVCCTARALNLVGWFGSQFYH